MNMHNSKDHSVDAVEYSMKDTILVNKDKYIELKAKAEVYDKVLQEHLKMMGVRGGGLYHDFAQFMEMIKTSRKGQMTLYVLHDIQLVILPIEKYKELMEAQKELSEYKCNETNYIIKKNPKD